MNKEADPVDLARALVTFIDDPDQLRDLIRNEFPRNPFSWHIDGIYTNDRAYCRKHYGKDFFDEALCPLLDDAWKEEREENDYWPDRHAWENMTEGWVPHQRAGESDLFIHEGFKFSFRLDWDHRGEWIKLERFAGWDPTELMEDEDGGGLHSPDEMADFLKGLYVFLVAANRIFDRSALERELSYQLLFQRARWEEGLREEAE